MVLSRNGPEILLQCGCGTGIRRVDYDPGEPWPAAKALGWVSPKALQESQLGPLLPRSLKPHW
jgi:hypothetical protein